MVNRGAIGTNGTLYSNKIKKMSNEEPKKEEVKIEKPVESKKPTLVTSTKTVDFPDLNWGINKGETRELPVEKSSQEIILSKDYITLIK